VWGAVPLAALAKTTRPASGVSAALDFFCANSETALYLFSLEDDQMQTHVTISSYEAFFLCGRTPRTADAIHAKRDTKKEESPMCVWREEVSYTPTGETYEERRKLFVRVSKE
jgi:hypothetical protein